MEVCVHLVARVRRESGVLGRQMSLDLFRNILGLARSLKRTKI